MKVLLFLGAVMVIVGISQGNHKASFSRKHVPVVIRPEPYTETNDQLFRAQLVAPDAHYSHLFWVQRTWIRHEHYYI